MKLLFVRTCLIIGGVFILPWVYFTTLFKALRYAWLEVCINVESVKYRWNGNLSLPKKD